MKLPWSTVSARGQVPVQSKRALVRMCAWSQRTAHLYWIFQVRLWEEAIETAKRAPTANIEIILVSHIYEMGDFFADVQKAAEGFEDHLSRCGQCRPRLTAICGTLEHFGVPRKPSISPLHQFD